MHQRKHNEANDRLLLPVSSKQSSSKTESTRKEHKMASREQPNPISLKTFSNAGLYVLSGCCQPLIVTLIKAAGLADHNCQLYMLPYYVLPAIYLFFVVLNDPREQKWPHRRTIYKACGAALWDIASQSLNYTGATMSGPTIFAIIYSSVTIWTAIFSQLVLGRKMNIWQWTNVLIVFGGLTITAVDSSNMGKNVIRGSLYIMLGSAMHGLSYVFSEAVMTIVDEKLTAVQNNFVQGTVAGASFLLWQLVYTLPHSSDITGPMQSAGTSVWYALVLLGAFGLSNVVHSYTYFHTLLNFPLGATSAGVMKGLQAVLVFVVSDYFYCNKIGGSEMCFSEAKLASLITVCGGVLGYGYATRVSLGTAAEARDHSSKETIEFEPVNETANLLSVSP
mmetsp:Transcript_18382/g.42195  ORF Transcript_18382/g.42195 Transcript_18382/m.42195 type:complete len:392 (-) Transcript_18382:471-1646(-)